MNPGARTWPAPGGGGRTGHGPGVGMMTAVDVRTWHRSFRHEGMYVDATVGVSTPQWAAG